VTKKLGIFKSCIKRNSSSRKLTPPPSGIGDFSLFCLFRFFGFLAPKDFYVIWFWANMTKVVHETCRAH
jgi:hypothetical protein